MTSNKVDAYIKGGLVNESCLKIMGEDPDTLLVSFSGHDLRFYTGLPQFEFVNFFQKHFNNITRHFYIDKNKNSYHQGINGITTNVEETVEYLKNEIRDYKNVIFVGSSAGGYAAILFGSLLNITSVLAFIPQTIRLDKNIDEKYRDITPFINDTTKYYLYGDLSINRESHCHHILHCDRVSHHANVFITRQKHLHMKTMRDNGELYDIFHKLIMQV
jgi:hypothetical protein